MYIHLLSNDFFFFFFFFSGTISTFTEEEDKDERYVVPALPMSLAIVCCVLNFAIPGLGK